MRVLQIGEEEKQALKRVHDYAQANPFLLAEMERRIADPNIVPPGDIDEFRCEIPYGYKVVLTFEEQPSPFGMCRHVSISVPVDGLYPSIEAVAEILPFLGFTLGPREAYTYVMEGAVNVIEPVENAKEKLDKHRKNTRVKTKWT